MRARTWLLSSLLCPQCEEQCLAYRWCSHLLSNCISSWLSQLSWELNASSPLHMWKAWGYKRVASRTTLGLDCNVHILRIKMWWLILRVNLTEPWGTQMFGQILPWVFPGGCFCLSLTFKVIDWIEQNALPDVGGYHPISCIPEEKPRLTMPWRRGISSCLLPLSHNTDFFFLHLRAWTEKLALSGSQGCQPLERKYVISSPGLPA